MVRVGPLAPHFSAELSQQKQKALAETGKEVTEATLAVIIH
jgi:hypothetical protein